MRNIESSTVELVEDFLRQGGRAFALGPPSDTVDGEKSEGCKRLFQHEGLIEVKGLSGLAQLLEKNIKREISIKEKNGLEAPSIIYLQREIDGKKVFFIVNLDKEMAHQVDIFFKSEGRVEEWNALTGEVTGIAAREENGYLSLSAYFGPAASKLFIIDPRGKPATEVPLNREILFTHGWQKSSMVAFIGPNTQFERTDPNVLTLGLTAK